VTHDGHGATAGYTLRRPCNTLGNRKGIFKLVMDQPHSNKSYYPPTQFVQDGHVNSKVVFEHVMTQMSAKAGIRKHGKAAEDALIAEFSQMEDLNVYEPISPSTLSREQKKGALRTINMIKEKRCSKLKGRTVADGQPLRMLYDKSETTSPTVATDALMLSIIINAHKGRDVATANIAGAYLKAQMDDFVLMKFTSELVDIMCYERQIQRVRCW
jgi:hypothetical protein